MTTMAERVRAKRIEKSLTQSRLAQLAGVQTLAISSIENGHTTNPSAETLKGLAEALECSVQYLLFGEAQHDHKLDDSEPLADRMLREYGEKFGFSPEKSAWIRRELPEYDRNSIGSTPLTIAVAIEQLARQYDHGSGKKLPPPDRERVDESHDTGRGGMRLAPSKKKR